MLPEPHPLLQLFNDLVDHYFDSELHVTDTGIKNYVGALLYEFCETDQLFKIRTIENHPRAITDVGEMLIETDPIYGPAPSFDRERQVRKHIGDYTLFFLGMFPESINHYRLRRHRLEGFVDIMKAGKESYQIVSMFDQFEYATVAPLFAKLAANFEPCVYGLNLVKSDLQAMQHSLSQRAQDIVI